MELRKSLFLIFIVSIVLGGCEELGLTEEGEFTLSGVLSKSGIADGTMAYMTMVDEGDDWDDESLYGAEAAFSGGAASYAVEGIAAGDYTIYAFIDVDGSSPDGSAGPNLGDWVTESDISIDSDETLDAEDDVWDLWDGSSSDGTATIHFNLYGDMSVNASSPVLFYVWEYDESSPDIDWSSPDETVRFESLSETGDFEIDAGVQYFGFPFLDNDNNGLDAGDDLEEVYLFEFDDGDEEDFTIYCWSNSMGLHQLADMDHLNYIVHVEYNYTGTQPVGEEPDDGWMTVVFTASEDFNVESAIIYAANMGGAHNERAIIGVPPGSPVYFWFFLDMDRSEDPSPGDFLSFDPSPDGTIPDSFTPVALADYTGPESIEKADADMTEILGEIDPPPVEQ